MAEGQTHGDDDEVFDINNADEKGSPDVSNTEDEGGDSEKKNADTSENGEENIEVPLKLEDKEVPAEVARKRQEDAWYGKIISGEKTLDDLPKQQQWLKKPLQERLQANEKAKEITKDYDIDALLDEKIKERDDVTGFKSIKAELNNASLTTKQKADIESEFKDLRANGLSRVKALEKALRYAHVDLDQDSIRRNMALPRASTKKAPRDESDPRMKYPKGDPRRVKALSELAEAT